MTGTEAVKIAQNALSKLKSKSNKKARIKPKKATVIGIFSCKGGVGKTTTVSNLAYALANTLWNDVLAVDANLTAPNLSIHLGELDPDKTIHDVLAEEIPIQQSISQPQNHNGLDVIFGSIAFGEEVHLVDLESHLKPLKKKYKIILIDSAPGLGNEVISAMKSCDEILIVTGPEMPTVASTLKTFHAAERYKIPITGTVVNKITGAEFELPINDIKQALGWPIVAQIPHEEKVRESTAEGTPIVEYDPKNQAAAEFEKLGERVLRRLKKS